MKLRVLITGGTGFVAGSVIRQRPDDWDLHTVARSAAPVGLKGATWHVQNLCEDPGLAALLDRLKPEVIIHTAALADIDYCEKYPDLALATNTDVTRRLAQWAAAHDARLIFLSTDNVFDGGQGYYREDDPPRAINHYAETKILAEEAVTAASPNAVVARVSLVLGLPMIGAGNSMLARMLPALSEGRTVRMPPHEIRSPIDVITLGRALIELAGHGYTGFLHLSGNEVIDRYKMAGHIARAFGYSQELIQPQADVEIPGRAPRPKDVSLCNERARELLETPMLGLAESLQLIRATQSP